MSTGEASVSRRGMRSGVVSGKGRTRPGWAVGTAVLLAVCASAFSAAPVSANTTGDLGWTASASVVGTTGAISFDPGWRCAFSCRYSGGSTHFTATALNGATFTPGSAILRSGPSPFSPTRANCTATATLIDCVAVSATFSQPSATVLTPVPPFTLNVPASTPNATAVVERGWHDTGTVGAGNDPANDTQAVIFSQGSGSVGDWGHETSEVVRGPGTYGTYGNDIGWTCLSPTCRYDASTQFTAAASNGATFADAVGSQVSLVSDTAHVGVCTVASETALTCAPSAAGFLSVGEGLSTSARYTVPAGLPDRTPVLEIGWSDPGASGNDPSNDTLTVLAVTSVAPHDPVVVFGEGFEHGQDATPRIVTDYVGAPPLAQTYTADPPWLQDCNGLIISMLAVDGTLPASLSNCNQTAGDPDGLLQDLEAMSWALGTLDAAPTGVDPNVNHAVTAYSQTDPGAPLVELETVEAIPVTPGHFYTAGLSAVAVNCVGTAHPLLAFNLLDGASVVPVFDDLANPCTQRDRTLVAPNLPGDIAAARFAADSPVVVQSSELRLQVVNHQPAGFGNDGAIDNLQLLDVTPRLEKAFAPGAVAPGVPATLTLTIVNSTDRLAKAGWSFTDTLPQGLRVADPGTVENSCPDSTVDAPAGGGAVSVTGSLAAGQTDCNVTVRVVAAEQGIYDNCAANLTNLAGMLAPTSCARLTVSNPPRPGEVSVDKRASDGRVTIGDTVTYRLVAKNNSAGQADGVVVEDRVPSRLDVRGASATQGDCTVSGNRVRCDIGTLAAGQEATVTVRAVATESGQSTNTGIVIAERCPAAPCDTDPAKVTIVKPKLRVAKTAAKARVRAGNTLTYAIRVTNPSKRAVRNVRTCDLLPAGLVPVSATPKVKVSKGRYCWTAKRLGAGKSKTYEITVRALPGAAGRRVNRATASSPGVRKTARAVRAVRVLAGEQAPEGGVTG